MASESLKCHCDPKFLLYDELYNRYRAGTIQRHIGNNGRYLQYTWLRSEDGVDLGLDSVQYPIIDLAPNARKIQQQFFGISPGEVKLDFIEFSEEKRPDVLENGLGTPTGFLRRGRHPWWPNQFGDGTKWGASADELTGVLFGLKFFIDATGASNDQETMI